MLYKLNICKEDKCVRTQLTNGAACLNLSAQ